VLTATLETLPRLKPDLVLLCRDLLCTGQMNRVVFAIIQMAALSGLGFECGDH
jgi:hypothetical protein